MIYTIPATEREKLEKLAGRLMKKAAAYGSEFSIKFGENYAAERDVFKAECGVQSFVGKQMIEVFDIDIDGEMIRKDGYKVVAKIEHMAEGNIVSKVAPDETQEPEWSYIPARCEHCGGRHGQKVTFIVRDAEGNKKQVGRTCLKDYCGINPQLIGIFNHLTDLVLDADISHYDFDTKPIPKAYDTKKMLAVAIGLSARFGYRSSSCISGSNKEMMFDACDDPKLSAEEAKEAEELAEKILAIDENEARDALLDNVQTLLRCGYCKKAHFGRIAYAPLAYERYIEHKAKIEAREAAKNVERDASHFIGEIGKRMDIDVSSFQLVSSWDGDYGTTYLYKIIDALGNIMVWFGSKYIAHPADVKHIRGTVKDHTERDGVKQTVLTRCTVKAA